ncbi:electron transfer flavoprotein alpha-subunit [Histoplasma capsulatum]|uniref:Electron transfer flavoprotein alpha-subunit n=1 Tax=Ajellomyces capsulatus TaxID=5037 RepID=A0A8H7Z5M7_AJECA|nr:electron transfer flavoprotein alpha-subunit [Histoplasma capsulatum]
MNSVIARHSILRATTPLRSQSIRRSQLSALSRLLSTLAVLEQRDGKIQGSSLSAITAAQKLGGSVTAFVAGVV